jgi:hypothetical protein
MKYAMVVLALAGAAALAACSPYPRIEASFGDAVQHMIESQTVSTTPADTKPVETGDGERSNNVLEAYRTDVSRTEPTAPPVSVTFGSGPPR